MKHEHSRVQQKCLFWQIVRGFIQFKIENCVLPLNRVGFSLRMKAKQCTKQNWQGKEEEKVTTQNCQIWAREREVGD